MSNNHNHECDCGCKQQNFRTINSKQDIYIEKYGFVIHNIIPDGDTNYADFHTHGLRKNKNHPELQIVLNLAPEIAAALIHNVVHKIDLGSKYKDGDRIDGVILEYDVLLLEKIVDNEKLLRIIIPDENGLFPEDEDCDSIYKDQARDDLPSSDDL